MQPQFVQNDSATDRNLNDPSFPDLYLSTPVDPEEASFRSSAIRLTPARDDDQPSAHNPSASPRDYPTKSVSSPANNEDYATSFSEFLSPADEFTSDLSANTSPIAEFMVVPGSWQLDGSPAPDRLGSVASDLSSPQTTMNPAQLLTPNLTNNPSPSPDTSSIKSQRGSRAVPYPAIHPLITTSLSDSLGVQVAPDSARAISPIVKVESYSRGDSPVRESFLGPRCPSQSSVHLSPGGMSTGSEEDEGSITRAPNGAWVPSKTTGHSGIEPTARQDIYVPSPNEMESQRQLAERNADIRIWSEAVSEAHSDAGDVMPSQRGRTDHHRTRRRAKSAGDPSLQQDYFNLKFYDGGANVPGPGLVIKETSDYSDDASESPPVSVNEERWTQEAAEISPPEEPVPEEGGPLPHQFLGAAPWRDPEPDSSPQPTRNQPVNSTQAMAEYQRRANELDAASRWATWGTRDIDGNSIKSFQKLTINAKGKKHERRNSLLRFLPGKQANNLLKRQRQPTDLSIDQPGSENVNRAGENKPTPQRKDSFPHRKLSLGLSPKSPSYSTGGAVIAMTRQMAAIGGKDSLGVVSPSSTTKPWASFKARGRSRSEVPKAPGLFELMTNHGGPPVPNLNYIRAMEKKEEVKRTAKQDAGDEDEDEDLDDDDEKGLVMEFPIQPNLPVPTQEGFKNQIIQLNPRLAPALVERFAHEQLRRYRKLIEIKQNHAQAVRSGKCKAGKYCFAQGGQAKLLPPPPSHQDSEFTHTQFQIPGRGETVDNPETLGETAIATAQFPPGVPPPPSQVKVLPAEFECPVCFQVKKFQKPSDWTKHIYEDVQPFTCSFPDCPDPKSFKRKADWVRHESERHRQLEWWECTFPDCRHKCYRKDNFVQHLVREHKLPEPKMKKTKTKGSGGRVPSDPITPEMQEELNREQEFNRLWRLVESCRHATTKSPRDEPCRFCGNVCTNWKKLTVHLAKHMEQIAIPILGLVDERDFSHGPNEISAPDGKANPGVDSIPIVQNSDNGFTPNMNEVVPDGLGASITFTQTQYGNGHGVHFNMNPTYLPATSMLMQGGGCISAEPDSTESVSPFDPPELAGGHDQARLLLMHQNSVTYPPPFNAGPRPRVSHQELSVLQDYHNNFSMSPTEMQYDPQSAVYVSTTAENSYPYQGPMASTMPYNGPGGYPDQRP
ncbi:hypothetical protein ARAM_002462 [Aspergillus rambellii]|uniref:C2H2-type domain-containing protein n=1 Tax=Aspergillus rambellii TaxID=308745 RepID=A0A0F8WEZ0_9EURO|nr:hypothetical protein ARAM_002462 [Aspergillus rambellii]